MVQTSKPVPKKEESLSLPVYDLEGKKKTSAKLDKEMFSIPLNKALLAQYVRVYLTNQRQGTVSTKTRAEVIGTTRKLYRQKGTGRARHGSKKASLFVGGGVTFGPRPRDFSLKMNKKQKKKILFGALTQALKDKNILGLTDESLSVTPKTKTIAHFLHQMDLADKKTLFILPKLEKNNFVLAARNIENLSLADAKSLNAYLLVNCQKIILFPQTIKVLRDHFLKTHEN